MDILFILLQAEGGGGSEGGGGFSMIFFMVAFLAIFYFFMIRPQQQKQKKERQFQDSLEPGMKIRTIGGIIGKITKVEEDGVLVQVDPSTKLKFIRGAIMPVEEEPKS